MEHKIANKESFSIIGIELKTTANEGKNFIEIPQFWDKALQQGWIDDIPDKKYPGTVLGICTDFKTDGTFSYIIGSEVVNTGNTPEAMACRTIPGATYAVFTARGKMPGSIQDTVKYIYQKWLPGSEYDRADSADFELYDERCHGGEHAEVDIYIPIVSS